MLRRHLRVFACALAPMLAGCSSPSRPVDPGTRVPERAPIPDSPVYAVRLFEWCWDHRDPNRLREVLTDDYTFVFTAADSAGNVYRNRPFTREDELDTSNHLFWLGNGPYPPANTISLDFEKDLISLPDSRPGKNARWHREIATAYVLRIDTGLTDFEVQGFVRFFIVRGDSAAIPRDLVDRGFQPDSTRCYIEQIQEETLGAGSLRSEHAARDMAARSTTWGQVKALYHSPAWSASRNPR